MQDLIERLEKATGPSRELDCLVAIAADARPPVFEWDPEPMHFDAMARVVRVGPGYGPCFDPPQYTASIDAALTLVPKDTQWTIEQDAAWVRRLSKEDVDEFQGVLFQREGTCTAIAICIAALKARANATV